MTATATAHQRPAGGGRELQLGRGASYKQFDLRVAKKFSLGSRTRLELIAEIFNLQLEEPRAFSDNQSATNFGEPTQFAGDFQRGEQRVGQLGIRFEF